MKRQAKMEKAPQPISLAGRKTNLKTTVETSSFKPEIQSPVLRPLENNYQLSSASIISNMKQQLCSIKLDVEKLIMAEEPVENKLTQKMDIFNQSLKDELVYQKKIEEQLRREIRELKLKLSDSKPREQRLAFERKLQELKADKFKTDRQKDNLLEKIRRLQQELEAFQYQTKDDQKGGKYQQLIRQLEKVNSQKKHFAGEVVRLQETLQIQAKDLTEHLINGNQTHSLKSRILQLQKQKLNYANRLRQKDNDIEQITNKFQITMKDTEAKYYGSIAEFKNLTAHMEQSKYEQLQGANTRIYQLQNELGEVRHQLVKQKQQATRKTKNKPVDQYSEHLKRQMTETKKQLEASQEKYRQQKEESDALFKQIEAIQEIRQKLRQESQIKSHKIKELEKVMACLKSGYERQLKQTISMMQKVKATTATQISLVKAEAQVEIVGLKDMIKRVSAQRQAISIENQRKQTKHQIVTVNAQCQTFPKQQTVQSSCQTLPNPKTNSHTYSNSTQTTTSPKQHTSTQSDQVCPQTHPSFVDEDQYLELEQQARKLRLEKMSLQITINQLNSEVSRLEQEMRCQGDFNRQKDAYIAELEKQKQLMEGGEMYRELEDKFRQMSEDQIRMAQDYEFKILRLENFIQQSKQKNQMMYSRASNLQDTACFDEALKHQLTENEQLKSQVKQKHEQILQVRSQCDDWRRKAEALKSQTDIDRLKGFTQEKTLKNHYEINIQNLKNDMENLKRKQETLQRKIDFKTDQLKKKDEFIQKVIVGKVGKDDKANELEFIRKELETFFSSNYEERLFNAQQKIRQLSEKTAI